MKPLLQAEETPVIKKTRELCQTILDQPSFAEMRSGIREFMSNQESVARYQRLCELQEVLHTKQDEGESVTDEEMEAFEREEQLFLADPLAQEFIKVQRAMHKVEMTVAQYVRKTLELGRLPEENDFGGGCGPGCGCH